MAHRRTVEEHTELVDALEARDVERASQSWPITSCAQPTSTTGSVPSGFQGCHPISRLSVRRTVEPSERTRYAHASSSCPVEQQWSRFASAHSSPDQPEMLPAARA